MPKGLDPPPISPLGFGRKSVSSRRPVPCHPPRMTAFMIGKTPEIQVWKWGNQTCGSAKSSQPVRIHCKVHAFCGVETNHGIMNSDLRSERNLGDTSRFYQQNSKQNRGIPYIARYLQSRCTESPRYRVERAQKPKRPGTPRSIRPDLRSPAVVEPQDQVNLTETRRGNKGIPGGSIVTRRSR